MASSRLGAQPQYAGQPTIELALYGIGVAAMMARYACIFSRKDAMESKDAVKALITDPQLQQRLAKHIVLKCFRNSLLEEFHAGIVPDTASGDYADVSVRTPHGEIPWNRLSRISDPEMKALMIDVTNRTYQFVQELFDEEKGGRLMLQLTERDPLPFWEEPKRDE